ncbi:MAG: hypothetical protein IKY65_04525 [Rikenellaceae bacterium]|nr:hypothetical protein [Rikenellaceae bacterium]
MASNSIKGLTVEIGGDTTQLGKALDNVNNKSRDLTSELGQINRLLKMDPKNTELLSQKQKVLAAAIANTAEKLETLKQAEKQVQKQFERGEVSEEQVRALKREIVATEKQLESYEKQTKETAQSVEKFGKSTTDAKDKTNKFGSTVKSVGSAAVKTFTAVAAAAAAAAAAMAKMSVDAAAYADEILTQSTVTGISTEKLQAYAYAAELVDVSVDTLTKSHAKQIKSMKAAQDGTKLAVEAYEKLGVEVTNIDGSLRDGETVYWEVIDALGKMENETERDAIAMQILGKSAQELNPLIEAGAEKMAELTQEAHDVGAVMSEETLSSLGSLDDCIQRLKGSAGAAKNAIGTVLLPELTMLTQGGADLLSEFTKNLNATGGGIEGFISTLDTMAPEITQKITDLATGVLNKVVALAPSVVKLAISIVTNLCSAFISMTPDLLAAMYQIMTAIMDGMTAAIPDIVQALTDMIPRMVGALTEGVPMMLKGAMKLLLALVDAIGQILPVLIKAVPDIVMCIVDALLGAIPELLDGALQLLLAIVDAIPLLIEKLVPLIPEIAVAIALALLDCVPQLIKAAFTLLSAIAKAIPQACVALLKALPQIGKTLLNYLAQLPSKCIAIGTELVRGLWQGISNKYTWLKNQIQSFVGNVTKFLKKLFGINSPSKVTAYMGEMLDEGFAKGIKDNTKAPLDAMSDLSSEMIDAAGHVDGVTIERQINSSYSASAAAAAQQTASTLSKLDQILKAIQQGQILTIDGNALVGATANTMNQALGQRRVLAGRGAV